MDLFFDFFLGVSMDTMQSSVALSIIYSDINVCVLPASKPFQAITKMASELVYFGGILCVVLFSFGAVRVYFTACVCNGEFLDFCLNLICAFIWASMVLIR